MFLATSCRQNLIFGFGAPFSVGGPGQLSFCARDNQALFIGSISDECNIEAILGSSITNIINDVLLLHKNLNTFTSERLLRVCTLNFIP